jgi:hypothetical protein
MLSVAKMPRIPFDTLDQILSLQFLIAWAGEGLCDPPRLGWWRTDLVDEDGGGFILADLLPITSKWAALEAVRAAAIAVDREIRWKLSQPDQVRTPFFWGFEMDEQLADRLREHKLANLMQAPETILDVPLVLTKDYSEEDFKTAITIPGHQPSYKVVPYGRELKAPPMDWGLQMKQLTSALLPLEDNYPMPFYRLENDSGE